jgi:N-acetyl-anhydromuramyl-L-alanine amidase AmpD
VIHVMQWPKKGSTAEDCAAMFAHPTSPKASAHYCVDANSIVQCVREQNVAWHAPGANQNGIGIEHAGFSEQTAAEWADAYSVAMLERSAKLSAEICKRYDIPPVRLTVAELSEKGKKGFCGHIDCTNAFSNGKGHWDPGPAFPWDAYLARVRHYLGLTG